MKNVLKITIMFLSLILVLSGCSTNVDNKIVFQNASASDIAVNFRASIIEVSAGATVAVTEIPRGTYTYETTYSIPAGATSYNTSGEVSGELTIKAGTKVLIYYTSNFVDGVYTLNATLTVSDDLSNTGNSDPLNP